MKTQGLYSLVIVIGLILTTLSAEGTDAVKSVGYTINGRVDSKLN